MADMLKLYKMCIEEAEKRYKETGIGAYNVIAERLRKIVKEYEHEEG